MNNYTTLHMPEIIEGAKRTIRTFASATFLNDFGSDMVRSVWPEFVTSVLKANMVALGLLDGIGEGLLSISKAISGYLSDRIRKRKVFIWVGYILGATARMGYALSSTWVHLVPFRILDRIGKERSAPRDAVVADVSTHENRASNFGFLRAMDHLGGITGVAVCIILIRFIGYKWIFFIAAIPTFISALLVILFIKDSQPFTTSHGKKMSLKDVDRNFRLFVILSAVFAFGAFSYSFLLVFAKQIGFPATSLPMLYFIFTASASFFSLTFGRLADRIGRKPVLFSSYLLWLLVCLAFVLTQNMAIILVSFFLYGAYKGIIVTMQRTIVSECAPDEFRASCLGIFHMITGLCALPASFVAGLLWENFGMLAPFYLSIGLTVIAAFLLLFFREV